MRRLLLNMALLILTGCSCTSKDDAKAGGQAEPAVSLKLESDAKVVIVGGRQQLRVLAVTDGGTIDRSKGCQYRSSNENVADVLPGGIVRGKWSGKVTITATLNGVRSNALELQVLHAPPPMPK